QPSAEIQITQMDPFRAQLRNESDDAPQRFAKRLKLRDLRTDMRADAVPADLLRRCVLFVQRMRAIPIKPELVLVAARRNVWMPARLHVRIHANRNARHSPTSGNVLCRLLK